jgi:5'-phosphate synthase pdxT subunit
MRIGILSLQGDVQEHVFAMMRAIHDLKCRGDIIKIKEKSGIKGIDALVIPGGESSTIGKLLKKSKMDEEIRGVVEKGIPIMGTCAGLILLGMDNTNSLGLMDMKVKRNAFGRQRESFEADLRIPKIGEGLYHAIFIRAPVIEEVGNKVEILAEYNGEKVMAQEDNLIAAAFHPELTPDLRIHKYFLGLMKR